MARYPKSKDIWRLVDTKWQIASAIGAAACIAFSAWGALAQDCPGIAGQTHRLGNFSFVTNSRVEQDSGQYQRYTTCVRNLDDRDDLWVHWYIPGPRTWIPPRENVEFPRLSVDASKKPLTSCLEYGNLAAKTTAQFLGYKEDEDRLDKEKGLNCDRTTAQIQKASLNTTFGKLSFPVRLFFPSDSKKSKETMLEIVGGVLLSEIGRNEFASSFYYEARKYKDRNEGDVRQIRIRPIFRVNAEELYRAFENQAKSRTPALMEKGELTFRLGLNESWVLSNGTYEFIDREERVMGAFDFPVVVPAR